MIKYVKLHYNVALSNYEIELVIDEISQAQRLMGIINEELKLDEAEEHMEDDLSELENVSEVYAATINGEPCYYNSNTYVEYRCPVCDEKYILAPHEWEEGGTSFYCECCGEEIRCIANPDIK